MCVCVCVCVCVLCLDDGIVGGSGRSVSTFCYVLQAELSNICLDRSFDKCEVIPAARAWHAIRADLFSIFSCVLDGNFKLLGAPIGDEDFCTSLTDKQIRKCEASFEGIGKLKHVQSSYLLIKRCAGFAKLACLLRAVPPELHRSALQRFTGRLRP